MDMKKVDFSLVDQMHESLSTKPDFNMTRTELYKFMIKIDMIDKYGNPTRFAVENELIK